MTRFILSYTTNVVTVEGRAYFVSEWTKLAESPAVSSKTHKSVITVKDIINSTVSETKKFQKNGTPK